MAEEDTPMNDIETSQIEIRSRKYNNMRSDEDEINAVCYSPPIYMSLNELKKMKESVEKMFLSHEITMQEDFKMEKKQPPPNSLEGRVREIMEKAFWDVLDKDLKEEPPNYKHALVLLTEIKQDLLEMLTPTGQSMRSRIEEVLDLELINQKLENNAFDFSPYSEFIIETMSKMCAPLRDENIEQLKKIENIVPFYQEVFKLLGLMKLDLVNFTIQVAKPLFKQHSSEMEQQKFLEILAIQQDNGVDGLMLTKIWLSNSYKYYTQLQLSTSQPSSSSQPTSPQPSSSSPQPSSSSPTSSSISRQIKGTMIEAYVYLIYNELTLPETMLLDTARITNIKDSLGSILFVAYIFAISFVAGARRLDEDFKNKLKAQIFILTQDNVNPKNLSENSLAVCDQIVSQLNKWLVEKGDVVMSSDIEETLRIQIINCTDHTTPVCSVFDILHKRLRIFLRQALNSKDGCTFPQGFSCLSTELTVVVRSFLGVVSHNQSVFGGIYNDIIGDLIRKNTESPSNPTSTSPTSNNNASNTPPTTNTPPIDNADTITSNNNFTTSPVSQSE